MIDNIFESIQKIIPYSGIIFGDPFFLLFVGIVFISIAFVVLVAKYGS